MLLTPVLFILYDRLVLSRLPGDSRQAADEIDETGTVIIAGIGRFGQIVNRLLVASGVKTVVLDHEAAIIDMMETDRLQFHEATDRGWTPPPKGYAEEFED